ncbi:DUF2310 family Zn-ribbon-containing protein [Empedobacter brevis]|uniref:DUF2310 family Zn-ribbon-containing protein n=1 Tax=Empedobacter brevis TaxID=247 RepID=UPI0028A0DA2D|nr:DUF2310 family Zn-ribbon-containing protein [Empedobacter brevis]
MYIQQISLDINTTIDKNNLIDKFGLLMSFYRGSGQTQGYRESHYLDGNKIICFPFTLEKDSLHSNYNNYYVNRQIQKIEELCNSKINFKTVGKSYEGYNGGCQCKQSEFYILITNYSTIQSPITCGSCNKSVPLYKLPAYYDYGYLPILSWETNYQSCDNLQMNCEVGERWATNQMQNINSQLSKQGFKICREIETLTNTPIYYFIYNYRKKKNDFTEKCPTCNKKWKLKNQLLNFYDYKCDHCKIISIKTLNS